MCHKIHMFIDIKILKLPVITYLHIHSLIYSNLQRCSAKTLQVHLISFLRQLNTYGLEQNDIFFFFYLVKVKLTKQKDNFMKFLPAIMGP